jgi:hypothetical protein
MAHDSVALQPETRPHSLRVRLAVVLILASLPGVILGGLEAHRSFAAAAQAEQETLSQTAEQVAARLDDVVSGATILAESLAQSPSVRAADFNCARSLSTAADQSDRFGGVARCEARGRVICSSNAGSVGVNVADMEWFKDALASERPVLSPARVARVQGYQTLSISAPVRQGDNAQGLVVIALRGSWLLQRAATTASNAEISLVLFDSAGVPFASVRRANAPGDIENVARRALSGQGQSRDLHTAIASTTGGGIRVVAIAPNQGLVVASRALLIAAAPLLAVLASLAAVWFALDRWVLRWIDLLVLHAKRKPDPAREALALPTAPPELQLLGSAFDSAIAEARARSIELSEALDKNVALNRELHHRVKNSLQVFASGLARQLRRTRNVDARDALLEARVRLLPFALTIQYSPAREDLTLIDTAGYLPELTRQITAILSSLSTDVVVNVEAEHLFVTNEIAAAIGTIVAEGLTGGFLSGGGSQAHPLIVRFKVDGEGAAKIECGVTEPVPGHAEHALDAPLIGQLARQVGGAAEIGPGPLITVHRTAPAHEDA